MNKRFQLIFPTYTLEIFGEAFNNAQLCEYEPNIEGDLIKGKVNHETLFKTLLSTGVGVQGVEVKI